MTINMEESMSVSYVKLWKLLLDKNMKKTDLISAAGISTNVLAKLGKDEFVAMESIAKICRALNCDIGDVMEFNATTITPNNMNGENHD